MTPAEYFALRDVWESARLFHRSMYAGVQATLYNAHFKSKDGQRFQASEWMPGKPIESLTPDPKNASIIARAHEWRPATQEERDLVEERQRVFVDRQRRAQQAKDAGASREELMAIMNGESNGG
jgi:hypothetical protein